MFSVIEFRESDGGPPIKDNLKFEKLIRKVEQPLDSTWKLYPVQRIFYTSDEYEKAKEKRNKAQVTSDVVTDSEIDYTSHNNRRSKRQCKSCNVYSDTESSSDSENQILSNLVSKKKNLPRPPIIQVSGLESIIQHDQEKDQIGTDTCQQKDLIDVTPKGKHPVHIHTLSLNSPGTSSCISPLEATNNSFLSVNKPSTISVDDNGLQNPLLNLLLKNILTVKEQNRQILDILKKKDIPISTGLPVNLEVTLPVKSLEELEKLESYLQAEDNFKSFTSFCFSISNCKELIQKTNRILRSLVKDTVAKQFNYFGTNRLNKETNKRAFSQLMLNKVVQDAVRHDSNFTTVEVENAIKSWLKHAPSRLRNK